MSYEDKMLLLQFISTVIAVMLLIGKALDVMFPEDVKRIKEKLKANNRKTLGKILNILAFILGFIIPITFIILTYINIPFNEKWVIMMLLCTFTIFLYFIITFNILVIKIFKSQIRFNDISIKQAKSTIKRFKIIIKTLLLLNKEVEELKQNDDKNDNSQYTNLS